jgi:N-acetylglutamate synthase-like GNAT family acetyltransferase
MLVDLSESIKSDNNKWFVIRHNDNVVGCCQLLMYSNLIRSPYQKAVIDSVIIDERHQYLGYGQLLIEKVLEYANQQNVGKVQLISSFPRIQAHSFYEKMNFKKVGYGFILDLNNRTVNYY